MSRRTVLVGLAAGAAPAALVQAQSTGFSLLGVDAVRRAAAGGGGSDPLFASVVALLHFDGADLATVLVDNSAANHTVTGIATARLTTGQQKFGSASLNISATSLGATSADSADWNFAGGPFTIEAFVRPTATISGLEAIISQFASSNLAWWFGFNAGTLIFYYSLDGTTSTLVSSIYTPAQNTWTHVAVDRDASNNIRIYADGAMLANVASPGTFFDSTYTLVIGNDGFAAGRTFVGQIDELRITKGVARYGGAFTPPAAPFPNQ